jgi:hypothetical protein
MRRAYRAFVLVPALILLGCNGGGMTGTGTSLPATQHGGQMLALPSGKGFAELLVERGAVTKVAAKSPTKRRLLAYFYQPDGSTALTPAPSDVKVRLGSADSGTDVTLTPQSTPAGMFASEPGQYPDALRGQLALTLGGESIQTDFVFR